MMLGSYGYLVLFFQMHASVSVSRKQIDDQISNYFASKCSLYTTGFGFLAKYDVCKVPAVIPKGRLLSADGLKKGSKAKFICDDYHFTNISHGVCRADGTWKGLENPCVHMQGPLYVLHALGGLSPGRCVIILATPTHRRSPKTINLCSKDERTLIFHAHFYFNRHNVARNSFLNKRWGKTEKSSLPFWPLQHGQEVNLTLCVEDDVYRWYADKKELFTFKHRLPVTQVKVLRIGGFIVRSILFTDRVEK